MKVIIFLNFLTALTFVSAYSQIMYEPVPWEKGAFETKQYRNLFAEAGYSQDEINTKLQQIFYNLFEGPNRIYFEQSDSLAYISDIKNRDVRTEGMSYGMMIAVQFDKKHIFDKLWRWSTKYMQHHDGPFEGYFAWNCKTVGTRNAQGPASDGELYFITALIFASNRWGNDTGIDYLKEAQYILNCAMAKDGSNGVTNFINMKHKLINFVADTKGNTYTDPSYHIPAFYEAWAKWANDGRSELWLECAAASREYLHKAVHTATGLNPDQTEYDGTPRNNNRIIGKEFRFDSWRVPMNIALDYSWSCKDKEWQQSYGNKIQDFLYSQGIDSFVDQYSTDGTPVKDTLTAGGYKALRHSLGLVSTAAAVSSVCSHLKSWEFIDRFWKAEHKPYEDGYFDAYYDGLLQLFAFMHLSGNYRIIYPEEKITLSGLNPSDFVVEIGGKQNALYILRNKNGLEACITNYGGRVVSLMVPDKNGKLTDVVLGFANINDYLKSFSYFGTLLGRYAGRIADSRFVLDGTEYQLQAGFGKHCLHGGMGGFHMRVWDAVQIDGQTLELTHFSPDGEAGFPGNLHVKVIYTLTDDNALDIQYEAVTDKTTAINLSNHSYFNLSGKHNIPILDHLIQINADAFIPIDESFIPVGLIQPVEETPMDLRRLAPVGAHIDDDYAQIKLCKGYDHTWVLNTGGDINKLAAKVISENSGIVMEIYTSEPGIQFYTGMGASRMEGKSGINYPARGAFCLETQHYPDSPNQPDFPSTIIRQGEKYLSQCIYKFSIQK
ncbi:MAG: galactose-1-epimerase [Prevotellaceae bacterium]|jgi:oligosaccharide reducing-end xylanase|nr:galactose-1-epimerase [Prevotellaceae bacterium]